MPRSRRLGKAVPKNSIYYGHFRYTGELYEGKHQPIISKALFDKVQTVIASRTLHMPEKPQPKVYTGLLRCPECGLAVTGSKIKNRYGTRYTYYHCTEKSKNHKCSQKYVHEDELDRQLSDLLAPFALPDGWGD